MLPVADLLPQAMEKISQISTIDEEKRREKVAIYANKKKKKAAEKGQIEE